MGTLYLDMRPVARYVERTCELMHPIIRRDVAELDAEPLGYANLLQEASRSLRSHVHITVKRSRCEDEVMR